MARTQQKGATQFKDLPLWGKVAFLVAAAGGVAVGWFLPKWVTLLAIVILFPTVFVVQKLRGKA